MPQTPISSTVSTVSTTPTNIYTVPAGRTAIVKSAIGVSVIGGSSLTFNKVSGGIVYPVTIGETTNPSLATGSTPQGSANLLAGPITLSAGESISVSTATASAYKFVADYLASATINNVYFFNSTWIAIGTNTANGLGVVLTSSNGTTWTPQTFSFVSNLRDLTFGGGVYVAVGTVISGRVYTSPDLITWTQRTVPTVVGLNAVAFNGTHFIAVASNGTYISTTTPTTTWTLYTLASSPASILSIAWLNSTWVFGISGNMSAVSTNSDGTSPTFPYAITPSTTASTFLASQRNTAGNLFAFNGSTPYRSTNGGVNWTATTGVPIAPTGFTIGSDGIIAYNTGGTFYYSTDNGSTWTATSNNSSNFCLSATSNSLYATMTAARSGGIFGSISSFVINKGTVIWSTAGSGTGFVVNVWQVCNASGYQVLFTSNATNISTTFLNFATQAHGSTGSISKATFGTPNCSFWNGTSWFAVTNNGSILRCTSFNSSPASTGVSAPVNNIIAAAGNGNTFVFASNSNIYTSTDAGFSWTTVPLNVGIATTLINNAIGNALLYDTTTSRFVITLTNGMIMTSANGLVWNYLLSDVRTVEILNSQNLLQTATGLFTTTTPSSAYSLLTSTNLNGGNNVLNMAYAAGIYYFLKGSTIFKSTNLSTFTSTAVNTSALNNLTYMNAVIATTDGTNLLISDSVAGASQIAYEPTPELSVQNAYCTAGIVEIS